MATDPIKLTKDPLSLARLIDQHVDREMYRLSYRRATWLVALYYMMGARQFDVFDPTSGTVRYSYLDENDKMEFQSSELLSAVDKISGRMSSLDYRPLVQRVGSSLSSIRQRSIAQIMLDQVVSDHQLQRVVPQFNHIFALLGSCGITGHMVNHPTIGMTADLEVVHPLELFPFPTLAQDYTKQRGLLRQRMVSMDYLKDIFGPKVSRNKDRMEYYTIKPGDTYERHNPNTYAMGMAGSGEMLGTNMTYSDSKLHGEANATDNQDVVRVRELWLKGPRDTVSRYVVTSGEYVIHDEDLEGREVYCPIGFARFMENGSFHGAGVFDLLFPLCREAEKLQKQLFKNIHDIDRYGVLVLPHGSFNANTMLRDVGQGLRVFPWEPDPISEGFKPFNITPFNSGDVPGKVSAFAVQQIDRLNPIRDLIAEKGRVDSATGLQFLDEQVNRAMNTPTAGVQMAWGDCYRSVLAGTVREVVFSPKTFTVDQLTLDLAGVVVDPETMAVSFEQNPLPSLAQLSFKIKDINPRSKVARKQEALQLQQQFQIDPDTFMLFALKEGLDFAMWTDEHQSAYESVVRNCLFLYGDGKEPGQVVLTPQTTKPEMQIRVLNSFMASPTMAVAGPEVQNAFIEYHKTLMSFMGLVLPNALPNPDDVAMLGKLDQQMAQMQGASQGSGPQQQPRQGM
jgi:hypothetical protein